MQAFRCNTVAAAFLAIGCFVGCGGGEKSRPTVEIKGKVTLDGTPIEKGFISFESQGGQGSVQAAPIESGAYVAKVEPGMKRVRITAPKVVGNKKVYEGDPASPEEEITEETVPAQFNTQSSLEREVKSAAGDVDFELSTASSGK
jgi:hypothetical protein